MTASWELSKVTVSPFAVTVVFALSVIRVVTPVIAVCAGRRPASNATTPAATAKRPAKPAKMRGAS